MPQNAIADEVTTVAGFPSGTTFEAIVGDVINLNPVGATIGAPAVTLVQKPSGSAAAVVSGAFTCDLSGVYLATLVSAGVTRSLCFYCFTTAAIAQKIASGNQPTVTRAHLRVLVQAQAYAGLGAGQTNALRTHLEGAAPSVFVPAINWNSYLG